MPLAGAVVCTFAGYSQTSGTLIVPVYRIIQRGESSTCILIDEAPVWIKNDLLVGVRVPYATGEQIVRGGKVTRVTGIMDTSMYTTAEVIDLSPVLLSII